MAFVPTISVCLQKNCSKLVVTDDTGVYDATTNATGWEDAATLLATNVTALSIVVSQSGSTLTTQNVLTQLPGTMTGDLGFSEFAVAGLLDGEFTVTYKVTDASTTYTAIVTKFHACSVRCCIDAKWAAVANYETDLSNSGCDCASDTETEAIHLEGLYAAMNNAAASGDSTTRDALLTKLQRICDMDDCGCQ